MNPLPVAIMGMSIAWMMLGSRGGSGQGMMNRAADRIRDAAGNIADGVRSTAERTGRAATEKGSEWTNAGGERARDAADSLGSSAERAKGSEHSRAQSKDGGSLADSTRQDAGQMAEGAREALVVLQLCATRRLGDLRRYRRKWASNLRLNFQFDDGCGPSDRSGGRLSF
jgi:hypothetical protein